MVAITDKLIWISCQIIVVVVVELLVDTSEREGARTLVCVALARRLRPNTDEIEQSRDIMTD